MSPLELLAELERRGARLEPRGDRLHVVAPAGVITSDDRARLAAVKTELLALLQDIHFDPMSLCLRCGWWGLADDFAAHKATAEHLRAGPVAVLPPGKSYLPPPWWWEP